MGGPERTSVTRWFTSDHHFGHENINAFAGRPWGTVHEMNRALIDRWNMCVEDDDEVYIVGDFAWTLDDLAQTEELKGNKFLIPGNHDKCWKGKKHSQKFVPRYEAVGITVLEGSHIINVGNTPVLMNHFPYFHPGRINDHFSGNRPTDNGGWLLHGHTHSRERVIGRSIHVGVDAWSWMPVSEEEVARIIKPPKGQQ